MKRMLFAVVILTQPAVLLAQSLATVPTLDEATIKAHAPDPGVYVAAPNATPPLVRLTGSVSDGVKTSTGLGGMMRMKSMLKLILKDPRAPVHLPGQPVFYFIGNAPELYQLVRLFPKGKTREMNLGEIRTIFDKINSDFPDRIPLSATQVAEGIYQATAASPIEPGEYAVVEKMIVTALSSGDRKAGGPFVLGVGLDGTPVKKR